MDGRIGLDEWKEGRKDKLREWVEKRIEER